MEQSSVACPTGLLVYVASNPWRGTSQLMRSLTLAQQWLREGGHVSLVVDRLPKILEHEIKALGCQLHRLDASPINEDFARELCQLAGRERCGWIVLDDADDNLTHQVADLRSRSQKVLVLGETQATADFCTDSSPAFALIRQSLEKFQPARNSAGGAVRCILDFSRFSRAQLGLALNQVGRRFGDRPLKFEVVSSFALQAIDEIKSEHSALKAEFASHCNPDRLFQNLSWTKLVISTDESTFYETAFSGLPSVLLTEKEALCNLAPEITSVPWLVNCRHLDWIEKMERVMEQLLSHDRCRIKHAEEMVKLVDSQASVRLCQLMKRLEVSPHRVRTA